MKFAQYEIGARNEAVRNLNRKLQGKKIVWDNPRSVLAYKQLVREGGSKLKYRMGRAVGVKQEAVKAGFKTVEEYAGAQRVLFKPSVSLLAQQKAKRMYAEWEKRKSATDRGAFVSTGSAGGVSTGVKMSPEYSNWIFQTSKETQIGTEEISRINGTPVYNIVVMNKWGEKLREATAKERESYNLEYLKRSQAIGLPKEFDIKKDRDFLRVKIAGTSIPRLRAVIRNYPQLKGVLKQEVSRIRTKLERGGKLTAQEQIIMASATAVLVTAKHVAGYVQLPQTIKQIVKDPKILKQVPSAIKAGAVQFGYVLRVSPTEAIAQVGTTFMLLTLTAGVWSVVGQFSAKVFSILKNLFRGVKKSSFIIGSRAKFIPSITKVAKSKIKFLKTPKKIPTKPYPYTLSKTINESAIKDFYRKYFKKFGKNFDNLNKVDQKFLISKMKVKIRNRPDLFIPKARQIALKKVKKLPKPSLTQEEIIKRTSRVLKQRDFEIALKKLKKIIKEEPRFISLRKIKKEIKVAVQQKKLGKLSLGVLERRDLEIALKKLKTIIEKDPRFISLKRIKKAERTRLYKEMVGRRVETLRLKKPTDILSGTEKNWIKGQIKAHMKASPYKFIPKYRQRALKQFAKSQELKAIARAKSFAQKGKKLKITDLLSKSEKGYIKSRMESLARTQPERFIPSARQQALLQIQKPKVIVKEPIYRVVSPELSEIQKLALRRLAGAKKLDIKSSIRKAVSEVNAIQSKIKGRQRVIQLQQAQAQKFFIKTNSSLQKLKLMKRLSLRNKQLLSSLMTASGQLTRQLTLLKNAQKYLTLQSQKFSQAYRTILKTGQVPKLMQMPKLKITPSQKLVQRTAYVTPSATIQKRITKILPPGIKLKRKPPIKVVKKKRGYDVYARPLKRVKGKIPKQVKVNIVPLTKQRAEDLRNYLVDTSLSRTGSIRKVAGKPKKPRLKAPSGYGIRTQPKFRTYKIRKKKRVPLKTGKVIERKKRLLDTIQERKRITLLKRIAQMQKRAGIKSTSKKKVIRRAPVKSKIRRKSPKKRRRR